MNPTTYNIARMNMILHGVHYQRFDLKKQRKNPDDILFIDASKCYQSATEKVRRMSADKAMMNPNPLPSVASVSSVVLFPLH